MAEAKIAKAKIKRDVSMAQLSRLRTFLNKITETNSMTLPLFEVRFDALQKTFDAFIFYQNAIEELDEDEIQNTVRAEFEEEYFDLKAILLSMRDKIKNVMLVPLSYVT